MDLDEETGASYIVPIPRPVFVYDNPDAFEYLEYEPLPPGWIRLIRIVDGEWENWGTYGFMVHDLEIQMLDVPLDKAPAYDALSCSFIAAGRPSSLL